MPLNDIQLPRGRRLRLLPSLFVCSGRAGQREYKKSGNVQPVRAEHITVIFRYFFAVCQQIANKSEIFTDIQKKQKPLKRLV